MSDALWCVPRLHPKFTAQRKPGKRLFRIWVTTPLRDATAINARSVCSLSCFPMLAEVIQAGRGG